MKKVTKIVSLMAAVVLTATSFHASDYSVGSAKAQGENYLDPVKLSYNVGYQTFDNSNGRNVWYEFDLPQDGDLKITVLGNGLQIEKLYGGIENVNTFTWISAYENVSASSPYVAHFTASAGRYFMYVTNGNSDNYKINLEFSSYGIKDQFADSYANPKTYVPGTAVTDVVSYTDTYDWYKFEVPENGKYKISYTDHTGCFVFDILNADLKNYWNDSCVNENQLHTTYQYFAQGTYYIRIKGWAFSKYDFNIERQGINPTTIKKIKSKKKGQAEVKFKCVNNVNGYQLRYSTKKDFTGKVKTKTITYSSSSQPKNMTATLKKLKRHKNYYVQVRTFEKSSSGNYYYSDWSKSKKVRVK
ncbi:PPC domain-containing protein [Butyrivibrio sp. FC2001]|uniref:PPC domain-containing protein n=1 Tax=Butyrivibrio sp. FC2001 TaxID=1280671 RepID=UPI00040110D1|nr:PPC domain-containing protein [Butyrivibrio sp. FC2001]